ncbi:hypothetical protein AMTRI_Chr09g16980 [Amborella trichopoda]
MDFSSASSGSSSPPSTEALMDQVKTQLAQAYAQEFLELLSMDVKHVEVISRCHDFVVGYEFLFDLFKWK